MACTTTQFWICVQAMAGDSKLWDVTLEGLRREYRYSSDEVREQMRRDLETAIGRLILIDRTLNVAQSEYRKG